MLRWDVKPYLYLIVVFSALGGAVQASDEKHQSERWYQAEWCQEHNGQAEAVLEDQTRCDCITATHAVEVEFAKRWSQAVGQSLHYALKTGKRAGIVLILARPSSEKYLHRLKAIVDHFTLPITVWVIRDRAKSAEFDLY